MPGPEFFQTGMGQKFYNGQLPALIRGLDSIPELTKQLSRIADSLEKKDVKELPYTPDVNVQDDEFDLILKELTKRTKLLLTEATDEIFVKIHDEFGIESGDVYPDVMLQFDDNLDEVASEMANIMMHQIEEDRNH